MAAVKMVYTGYPLMISTIHKRDATQGKIPELDSFFHQLTPSHPNMKQLSGQFFNKYELQHSPLSLGGTPEQTCLELKCAFLAC